MAVHCEAVPLYAARLPLAMFEVFVIELFDPPRVMRQPAAPVDVVSPLQLFR